MKFRRIVFDLDGTIITHDKQNESEQIADILNMDESLRPEFKKRLQTFFSREVNKKIFANRKVTKELYLGIIDYIFNPIKDFRLTCEDIDKAIDEKVKYNSFLEQDVKETLEYLYNKGYELSILTNGFYKSQLEVLKYKGIDKYFERVFAWDNYFAKPDKRAFYRAIGNNAINNVAMVGDSLLSDIKPAKEIGMYTVGFRLKQNDKEKIMPDIIISNFKELTNLF